MVRGRGHVKVILIKRVCGGFYVVSLHALRSADQTLLLVLKKKRKMRGDRASGVVWDATAVD